MTTSTLIIVIGVSAVTQARPLPIEWTAECRTPQGYCPQGLAAVGGRLLLSAYRVPEGGSAVFALERRGDSRGFTKLFDLAGMDHCSGITGIPGRQGMLAAVDYRSNEIHLLDLPRSIRDGRAAVVARCTTRLSGASAVCCARLPNGQWLLVVNEFRVAGPSRYAFIDFHPGSPDLSRPGALAPVLEVHDLLSLRDARSYKQGLKFADGFVYESGNRLLGKSYIVRFRLADALVAGRIPAGGDAGADEVVEAEGPGCLVEDLAVFEGSIWVTDEGTGYLYRSGAAFD